MNRLFLALLPLAALAACAPGDEAPTITASDPWARATAPGQDMAAIYVTLTSSAADRLVGVSTPEGKASLHQSSHEGGMARMAAATSFDLPAGEAVALAPGGRHVMVSGLSRPLEAGQPFPLTLDFETAPDLTVAVAVVAPGSR